jgi:hypothetical protein
VTEGNVREAIASALRIGVRLRRSLDALRPLLPFDGPKVAGADPDLEVQTDAFLKRFESLVSQLQDQVWPQILESEGEDPVPLSRRDVMERMEKFHLVDSATAFRDAATLRNRLSHAYNFDPDRIAARLNEAYASAPVVLDALERVTAWAAARGISPAASG